MEVCEHTRNSVMTATPSCTTLRGMGEHAIRVTALLGWGELISWWIVGCQSTS